MKTKAIIIKELSKRKISISAFAMNAIGRKNSSWERWLHGTPSPSGTEPTITVDSLEDMMRFLQLEIVSK